MKNKLIICTAIISFVVSVLLIVFAAKLAVEFILDAHNQEVFEKCEGFGKATGRKTKLVSGECFVEFEGNLYPKEMLLGLISSED